MELNAGRGLSLREFFAGKPGVYSGYAPSSDANDPERYAEFVAGRVGVPVDQPLNVEPPGGPTPGPPVSPPAGRQGIGDDTMLAALVIGGLSVVMLAVG